MLKMIETTDKQIFKRVFPQKLKTNLIAPFLDFASEITGYIIILFNSFH